ncbi:MAG: sulfoxide reductase heme-binding subunit YedZ [Candidatus Azotimanducaceae bacterium]|jgi:sulfoxide reductase heme-binding subunit YedZ
MKVAQLHKPACFFASAVPLAYLLVIVWRYVQGDVAVLGADPGKEIVHYLGQWALILLLVTLSVSPFQFYFKVRVFPLRRMLGLFSFFYAVLHFSAYCVFLLELNFSEIWNEVIDRPYITVGALALLGMFPLAVTSTRAMQRRLGRNWKRLHRLIYPIAIFGIIHFIWQTRSDFTESLMYSAVLALLLSLRVYRSTRERPAKSVSVKT